MMTGLHHHEVLQVLQHIPISPADHQQNSHSSKAAHSQCLVFHLKEMSVSLPSECPLGFVSMAPDLRQSIQWDL